MADDRKHPRHLVGLASACRLVSRWLNTAPCRGRYGSRAGLARRRGAISMNQTNLLKIVKTANPLLSDIRAKEVAEALTRAVDDRLAKLDDNRRLYTDIDGFRVDALCDRPHDMDAFSLTAVVCTFDGKGNLVTARLDIVGPNEDMDRWGPSFTKSVWTRTPDPVEVTGTIRDLKTKAVVSQWVETCPNRHAIPTLPDGWVKAQERLVPMDFGMPRPTAEATHELTFIWPPKPGMVFHSYAVTYVAVAGGQ